MQVGGHAVDAAGQRAEFVGASHGYRAAELAAPVGLDAGAYVAQRAQQPPHVGVGQCRQRQQQGQRGPAEQARTQVVGRARQPEGDAVAIGAAAHQAEGGAVGVGGIAGVVAFAALVVVPGRARLAPAAAAVVALALRKRVEVHLRAVDTHRNRQPPGQCAGSFRIGRRAQVGRQPVGIVGDQRFHIVLPAVAQQLLHAHQEHRAGGQREQHEQHHKPALDRERQRVAPAPAGRRRGNHWTALDAVRCGMSAWVRPGALMTGPRQTGSQRCATCG